MGADNSLSVEDIGRLIDLVGEVSDRGQCTPSEAIESITKLFSPEVPEAQRCRSVLAAYVSPIRKLRTLRNELCGTNLFRDAAWDMLLEMFIAHERGEELAITSLGYSSGVPPSTATRTVARLEESGLATRVGHEEDTRRYIVKPTAKAIETVERLALALLEESEAVLELTQAAGVCCPNFDR